MSYETGDLTMTHQSRCGPGGATRPGRRIQVTTLVVESKLKAHDGVQDSRDMFRRDSSIGLLDSVPACVVFLGTFFLTTMRTKSVARAGVTVPRARHETAS